MKNSVIGFIIGTVVTASFAALATPLKVDGYNSRLTEFTPNYSGEVCIQSYPKLSKTELYLCHITATNYELLSEMRGIRKSQKKIQEDVDRIRSFGINVR